MAGMIRSAIRPILALALMLSLLGAEAATANGKSTGRVLVVVGAEPGRTAEAAGLVQRLGGDVDQRLAIIHGFTARVPAAAIHRLRRADQGVELLGLLARDGGQLLLGVAGMDRDLRSKTLLAPSHALLARGVMRFIASLFLLAR